MCRPLFVLIMLMLMHVSVVPPSACEQPSMRHGIGTLTAVKPDTLVSEAWARSHHSARRGHHVLRRYAPRRLRPT